MTTLNLVPMLLKLLSHRATSYHTLSPIFYKKVMSMATLNIVPRLHKMLSHLATSYHVLPDLLTLCPPSLIEK